MYLKKNKKLEPLYVMIGCDCDNDRKKFNKKITKNEISWEGFLNLYNYFNKARDIITNQTGLKPALTLNIRSDIQVKLTNGTYNYCYELFDKYLSSQYQEIDEIAWHHHNYKLVGNKLIQEMNDESWIKNHIYDSFKAIKNHKITTLHTGWCFQNTATMNAYNDVGIQIDYSALPGIGITQGNYCLYDYLKLKSNDIYYPDISDYQSKGDDQNRIIEIPVTTVKSELLRYTTFINSLIKTKKINRSLLNIQNTFIQINTNPILFKLFINQIFNKNRGIKYFATYFHVDELLDDKYKHSRAKLFYQQKNIITNILYLIKKALENNREIKFVNFKTFKKIKIRK